MVRRLLGSVELVMIDIVQWRASIGSYHSSRHFRRHSGNGRREIVLSRRQRLGPRLALSLCVALLMMCCGDIESNPGPLGTK